MSERFKLRDRARAASCLSLCFLFGPGLSFAVSETYLEAVSAEVREFEIGRFDLPPSSPWLPDKSTAGGIHDVDADMQRFEKDLRKKYPGTFLQYKNLSYWKKQSIYTDFKKTGDFSKARKQVLETLKND